MPTRRSFISLRWQHARVPAEDITNWVEFPGDPEAGWLPRSYHKAGIILFDREKMDTARNEYGGEHAVAYALGSAVMYGISHEKEIFRQKKDDEANYAIAMGIGKGVLSAVPGIWTPDRGFFAPDVSARAEEIVLTDRIPVGIKQV